MSIYKYIPNAITMGNLFSGCMAVLFAVNDRMEYAAAFVVLGIVFDFFDGFFARLLKVQSEVGLQLDSLADMVTSGLVPGIVMYKLLLNADGLPWGSDFQAQGSMLAYLGFAVTLASAYRLAKFNVDDRQTGSFIGLPTPANTLFILSLPLILKYGDLAFAKAALENVYVLIGVTAVCCYLLNAELPLFSLKMKSWGFKQNAIRYLFVLASVILIFILKFVAMPVVILLYVLLSLLFPEKNTEAPAL
jgi:CDP-diacylglycerol--serine O-phosphatidyltransferase